MVIVKPADDGNEADTKRYDRFRDRIMFPIRSVQGEVIGFGGRVIDQGEPKYLNSPETPVFSKGRELYGLFEARTALRQRGYALVVEGYMDVVALAQSGFGNAVATLGTACTAEHVQKLFRFTDSVVFSFDGDAAGRRAARRALEASLPHASDTRTVRFLFLPPEHDPDSYVRERGAEAFEACVAEAVPLSRQLRRSGADGCDLDTAEGRAHMLANAKPLWTALPDGALKRQLLGDLATAGRTATWANCAVSGAMAPLRPSPRAPRPSAAPARTRRPVSKGAATLLDRAIWLLLHRSELWTGLDGEHARRCWQPRRRPTTSSSAASSAACTSTAHSHPQHAGRVEAGGATSTERLDGPRTHRAVPRPGTGRRPGSRIHPGARLAAPARHRGRAGAALRVRRAVARLSAAQRPPHG